MTQAQHRRRHVRTKKVRLYGPNWSAYVRSTRLALIEKGVAYDPVDVDFSTGRMPAAHLDRHPFGKVPLLKHGDFSIFETTAIGRYVDAAFPGPSLQPSAPKDIGRMAQLIAIIDAYLSADIRMGIITERLINPMLGARCNEEIASKAETAVAKGFQALCECADGNGFLVGNHITLADLHAIPLIDYLQLTPGGSALVGSQPRLAAWWQQMAERPSVIATNPDLTVFNQSPSGSV